MAPERRSRVRKIFEQARALSGEEREALLDAECGDDPALRLELESLLQANDAAPEYLSRPVLGESIITEAGPAPDRIGAYRILSVLGEGGMGTVYEAEQSHPQRRVALKVLRTGLRSPRLLQRFRLEAELLARLRHPGIAQVFEAGTFSQEGRERPFIAMELVEGVALTDYVERNDLSVAARLELIAEICDAVHHAHQKGVIHRDLKPANILVDESGRPKILDLGIATATDSDLRVTTAGTEAGQILGTLPYMSPEQVRGRPDEIDVRSDVYAIGVIAYRLLTDHLPLDLKDVSLVEAARIVTESDPSLLGSIDRSYRGDVETIVAKALEKDRDRRYASAWELGQDLRRHLRHEVITARPASAWYQLSKFSRRNKGLVAGFAVALLALIGGLVGMGILLNRALAAEAEARVEADKANAVSGFFQDLLASVDPAQGPGKEVTVREMLDGASEELEDAFESQPEVRAVLHDTMGLTYRNIGNLDAARTHLERALEILRAQGDPETTASTMNHLAGLYWRLDLPEEAESLVREALVIRTELFGEVDSRTLELQNNLAILFRVRGKLDEAEALMRSQLRAQQQATDNEDPSLLTTMNNLASLLEAMGNLEEAEPLYLHVLEARRRSLGDRHPDTLGSIHNLATFYESAGRLDEAETHALEAAAGHTELYDEDHPETLRSLDVLVYVLTTQGKLDEAEPLAIDLVGRREAALGADHRDTLSSKETLVRILRDRGRLADAEALGRQVAATYVERLGEEHPRTLGARYNVAKILMADGRTEEATPMLEEVTRKADEVLPDGHRHRIVFRETLGRSLLLEGRFDEAEPVLLRGVEYCEEHGFDLGGLAEDLADLYDRWGKPEEAERWRSKLPAASG